MSDGEALLRAILMNPADDTARLVYADWLQENAGTNGFGPCPECKGEGRPSRQYPLTCHKCGGTGLVPVSNGNAERADFIRDQVWLWANPSCRSCTGPEWIAGKSCAECRERDERRGRTAVEMFGRERWLEWAGPARLCVPAGALWDDHVQFARGFVSEIRLPLAAFMDHAEALFRAHPIERVTLTDRWPWQGSIGGFIWESDQRTGYNLVTRAYVIPEVLYRHNVFSTEAEADKWLSARCVTYGRDLAGLPPLT